jgi:hypothetical protein
VAVTADGKHMAYVARDDKAFKSFVVIDGTRGPNYDQITGLSVSQRGGRFAYFAGSRDDKLRDRWVAVVDGVAGKSYDMVGQLAPGVWNNPFAFSDDGKHYAYGARQGNKQLLVVDGVEKKSFDAPASYQSPLPRAIFSPDGSRIAYQVQYPPRASNGTRPSGFVKENWRFVVDDKEEREFDADSHLVGMGGLPFGTPIFSPDGKHLAYTANNGFLITVVLDNLELGSFNEAGLLTFSPDSGHFAFLAGVMGGNRKDYFVVRDGKKGRGYPGISHDGALAGLVFSSDSRHLAYVVVSRTPSFLSKRAGFRIVVDGVESQEFDEAPLGPLAFDSPTKLHTLVGPKRIELTLLEK